MCACFYCKSLINRRRRRTRSSSSGDVVMDMDFVAQQREMFRTRSGYKAQPAPMVYLPMPIHLYTEGYTDKEHITCSICLDDFEEGDALRTLPCGGHHTFHAACIDEWFKRHSTCPSCKYDILGSLDNNQQASAPSHPDDPSAPPPPPANTRGAPNEVVQISVLPSPVPVRSLSTAHLDTDEYVAPGAVNQTSTPTLARSPTAPPRLMESTADGLRTSSSSSSSSTSRRSGGTAFDPSTTTATSTTNEPQVVNIRPSSGSPSLTRAAAALARSQSQRAMRRQVSFRQTGPSPSASSRRSAADAVVVVGDPPIYPRPQTSPPALTEQDTTTDDEIVQRREESIERPATSWTTAANRMMANTTTTNNNNNNNNDRNPFGEDHPQSTLDGVWIRRDAPLPPPPPPHPPVFIQPIARPTTADAYYNVDGVWVHPDRRATAAR
eukprot:CAMPEP_0184651910 /NCGR_PEP_ID=MMETSP0308-20130426/9570_1 /TAXON_ID=38269 /ORGANISM="Gloeochaete witrockiana, Strain SAG 46.84" /LENGTH=437 /DNA_ID=CAMNT_0027086459 /DNA_START=352 /DNA_END=1665 /DNA_ORIENTATION=+